MDWKCPNTSCHSAIFYFVIKDVLNVLGCADSYEYILVSWYIP